jgi:hypothetical protein
MNALCVIQPYWHAGTWVFDDEAVGLAREPFVAGLPEMIDCLVRGLPDARVGFRLIFAPTPFPGFQAKFDRQRAEAGGTWYRMCAPGPEMERWLCPAENSMYITGPAKHRASTVAIIAAIINGRVANLSFGG